MLKSTLNLCLLFFGASIIFGATAVPAAPPIPSSTTTSIIASAPFQHTPIILKASELLPAALIQGANYRISENVQNDGLINTYQIDTNQGFYFVESNAMLLERINELRALEKMNELERKGIFKKSLVNGVKAPLTLAGDIVNSPVKTTKDVAKGTGEFFSDLGRSIFSRDPYQANALKVVLGYDATTRKYAFEFLINPYTRFAPVEERLGEIAKASVAGGILPRAAMSAIGGPVGTSLALSSTARSMKLLVRDNPPGELRKINQKRLTAMGVSADLSNALLDNYHYDPETATILIGELETMKGVKGIKNFIAAATLAATPNRAYLYEITARMMANYHRLVARVVTLGMVGGLPYLINQEGMVVLPLPVDYIFWTRPVAAKLQAIDNALTKLPGLRGKEIWIGGMIEELAGNEFARRGWKLVQRVNPPK